MTKNPPSQPEPKGGATPPHPARNPAPRPALPRRTLRPLEERADDLGTDIDAWVAAARERAQEESAGPDRSVAAEPVAAASTPASPADAPVALVGRDALLTPTSAAPPAPARALASEPAKRPGRASVPSLSELMPRSAPSPVRPAEPPAAASPPGTPHHKQGKGKKPKPGKHHDHLAGPGNQTADQVELVVPLSKGLRKRLKAKAAMSGMTAEEATAQLVSVWVDG